ncbi:hypothetical protein T440DRAFT_128965 [Plenodomus tracheiphilus IPT5]|uniref:Uncharacterized protein n=1 Tax=Plenodomus tracheiphilus IPT5 TaxID=1408161 RepID=A0A6A7B589_9PLEO|nr:hypothetical protein T440DRAFT_128965 [Plenodomus tracheiphilus IPT5]
MLIHLFFEHTCSSTSRTTEAARAGSCCLILLLALFRPNSLTFTSHGISCPPLLPVPSEERLHSGCQVTSPQRARRPRLYKAAAAHSVSCSLPHFGPHFASRKRSFLHTKLPAQFVPMARLAAPPPPAYSSPLKIPVSTPISIQSTSSTSSNPVTKRSMLSRPVLHQAAPKTQIVRKATGQSLALPASSRSSSILPLSRVDYECTTGLFSISQIPRPINAAIKAAAFRRCSKILQRLPSVVIRPARAAANALSPIVEATAVSPAIQYLEPEDDNTTGADESTIFCEAGDDIDNSELLLEDDSFNETLKVKRQTSYAAFLARAVVANRRLETGRRGHLLPDFFGCALVPKYTGDNLVLGRKRQLPVDRVLLAKQQHAFYTPAVAPRKSRLPFLVWPLVKPVVAACSPVAAPVKPSASRIPRRPVVKVVRTQAAVIVKPTAVSFLKRGTKSNRTARAPVPVKTTRKVAVTPVKPVAATFLKRRTGVARFAAAPVKSAAVPVPKRARAVKTGSAKFTAPVKVAVSVKPTATSAPAVPGLKSAFRQRDSTRPAKPVQFTEGPFNTKLYSLDDPVKQLSTVSTSADETTEWSPIAPLCRYPVTSGGTGTKQLFEVTYDGPMTLTRKFLNRFASVQRAEVLRWQDCFLAGECPELGQLEYGNTDFKVALQAKDVIKYEDIGTTMNASDFSPSASPSMGRVVVFGRFPGSYRDAAIPEKMVVPWKTPLEYPKGMKIGQAKRWISDNIDGTPRADLET